MTYHSFLSKDERKIFIDEEILKKSPVIFNILNFDKKFGDKPEKIGDSFLLFNDLNTLSILLIIEYLKLEDDSDLLLNIENNEETKQMVSLYNIKYYVSAMSEIEFLETILFAHPLCINIPPNLYNVFNKKPVFKEEDLECQYQFLDFQYYYSTSSSFKDNHEILLNYLNSGWEVCNQSFKNSVSNVSNKGYVTLRKKLIFIL